MRVLLDTHIWVWSLDDPNRLSNRVVDILQDSQNEIWLSPISVWEVLLLVEKGRMGLDREPEQWVHDALSVSRLKEATLNDRVAIRSRSVELPHQDPADRFLAATAEVFELTLVTDDERLMTGGSWAVLPNREP
ncbi:MAG: type II toxin-antitoxin system VapC family toxin [Gemmatimonadota bacterium]